MGKKVTQLIEEQVHYWTSRDAAERKYVLTKKKFPVITVSREFGAKGAALTEKLGARLGFKVWDKDLLVLISNSLGSDAKYIQTLDENRRSMLEDALFGFMMQRETNVNFLITLARTVRTLEKIGNNIIVGRGANYICTKPASFHVRVVRPFKQRVMEYAAKEGVSRNEAEEFIHNKDEERADFVKINFNRDLATASNYDLILNSATFSLDEMADLVIKAYEFKTGLKLPVNKERLAVV